MSARALTLAIHLLGAAAAGGALLTAQGCTCGGWAELDQQDLGVSADLLAVATSDQLGSGYSHVAVGRDGTVVAWHVEDPTIDPRVSQVGDADLRAVWIDEPLWWVVGDAGTAAVSDDQGATWLPLELPSSANLRALVAVGGRLVIAGDEVVLVQAHDGTWSEISPPEGSWGSLRALYFDGSRVYAVGTEGIVWSATDPEGEWSVEAKLGALADLGHFDGQGRDEVVAVGAGGAMYVRDDAGWHEAKTRVDVDLIAHEDGLVLGAGGEVFEIDDRERLVLVDTVADARAMTHTYGLGFVAVGEAGRAAYKPFHTCVGGRPFGSRRLALTAQPRPSRTGARTPDHVDAEAPKEALRRTLAEGWTRDALFEHASVASFARFGIELLTLGAPPALIRRVQSAILDELEHARLCFDLARALSGSAVGPGALPMPRGVLERAGDPVATGLALFDEGCVNESIAACEAAEAAARCREPRARAVLETIAADERRHAVLAWDALRWLLTVHGSELHAPLRRRVAALAVAPHVPRWGWSDALAVHLEAHGRLRPSLQAHARRRVLGELVRPLACALLDQVATARGES